MEMIILKTTRQEASYYCVGFIVFTAQITPIDHITTEDISKTDVQTHISIVNVDHFYCDH